MSDRLPFFLVAPENYFYVVRIVRTDKALQNEVANIRGRKCASDKDIRALCLRYKAEARDSLGALYTTKELGTILFQEKDRDNLPVVVHELTHAAVGWANRIDLDPIKCDRKKRPTHEERFSCVLQDFVQQYLVHTS